MKKLIIIYGLTQSGVQTANSLIESALAISEKTVNLSSYFKVIGDPYLSRDDKGFLHSYPTHDEASNQPFFKTYKKSNKGIIPYFDYAISRMRKPEEELDYRLRLLREDETDNIYVSSMSAFHETQIKVPLEEILQSQKSELIILNPKNKLSEHVKNFFGAYQTSIWTTTSESTVKTGEEIAFTQRTAEKFQKELELLKKRLGGQYKNARIVDSEIVDSPHLLAAQLGISAEGMKAAFQDAKFLDNWRSSDLANLNRWLGTLEV